MAAGLELVVDAASTLAGKPCRGCECNCVLSLYVRGLFCRFVGGASYKEEQS